MLGGYGHVSDGRGGSVGRSKKKIALISISSLVLVAMVVAVAVGVSHDNSRSGNDEGRDTSQIQSSTKAVKEICQITDYKRTCVDNLSSAAKNTTDPKELVQAAFRVAMNHVSEAVKKSTTLRELEKDKRASQALENCKELMDYAIEDLQRSFDELGDFDLSKLDNLLADIKIWLSGALTYEETCLDGFQNTSGNAGASMRKALKTAGELTRNGLAIVSELSSLLSSLAISGLNRRLLSTSEEPNYPKLTEDGFPTWASNSKRKLLAIPKIKIKPNVVVAKDGSGKYKTINEALNDVPKKTNATFIIYVKAGIYEENVMIPRKMNNIMLIGDGPLKTKITGNKNFIDGTPTFKTATVAVVGDGFIAKDIGFENSAGAAKHQAVALRVQSDQSIFYNCQMDGYQDTLYTHTHRQFYSQCTISGTIDFIFGNAAVIFQNCKMVVRKPLDNQQNIVTAQGRIYEREATGIVIQGCTIIADPALVPVKSKIPSYLGRPWKEYSRTIIMQTQINNVISPAGWLPWSGDYALNTCFYAEYNNKGVGSNLSNRVKWPCIKTPLTNEQALEFTASKFIQGDQWITPTGVPYSSGLSPT